MPKMISASIVLFILLSVVAGVACANVREQKPLDLALVVEAIRQVEHWDGRSIGASNEVGPWQVTPAVWREFSSKPIWWATIRSPECRAEQHAVALRHVTWINKHLFEIPLRESAYSIALVYTCGWKGVKHGNPSAAKRDYAQRVQNVYDELSKS